MDRKKLLTELEAAFGGGEQTRSVIARQAGDLADARRLEDDLGIEFTVETVVSNLSDAPEEYSLIERWNWWIGSLDLSHGGYRRFRVREDIGEESQHGQR